MKLVMAIDASKCMNCRACVLACQQRHDVPRGHSRNWVRTTAGAPAFQPGACMHCDDAPCVAACPTGATRQHDDGTVGVDKSVCIGCQSCVRACPYEARYIDTRVGTVDKCDYCAEARAQGTAPACVSICATGARVFGDADDPQAAVSVALAAQKTHSAVRPAEGGPRPTLVYLGEVADPHWPTPGPTGPMTVMPVLATAVRWLGGLSLFGVIAVYIRQRIAPSGSAGHKGDKA